MIVIYEYDSDNVEHVAFFKLCNRIVHKLTLKNMRSCVEKREFKDMYRRYKKWIEEVKSTDENGNQIKYYNYIAFLNNKPVGLLVSYSTSNDFHRSIFIDNLCTIRHNKGIGTELLGHLEMIANNNFKNSICLNVFDYNKNARKFYYNYGFEFIDGSYTMISSEMKLALKEE